MRAQFDRNIPSEGVIIYRVQTSDPLGKTQNNKINDLESRVSYLEGIAGTLAAIEYIASIVGGTHGDRRARIVASMTAVAEYERTLSKRFLDGVVTLPGMRVWGITDLGRLAERTPTFAMTSDRRSPHELATRLAEAGILAWDGHFYAQALIERLGLAESGGVLRLGFVHYTTTHEVDRTLEALTSS